MSHFRSGSLPNLPGYSVNRLVGKNFHKSHQFDLVAGTMVTDKRASEVAVPRPDDKMVIRALGEQDEDRLGGRQRSASDVMGNEPKWVTFDKKVLRFYAYSTEKVHDRRDEASRMRRFTIYYYLEDDSVHIDEARQENSGIPQGLFLKRGRIKRDNQNEYIEPTDFQVGRDVVIHKRTFHIVDADPATRNFMQATYGVELGAAEPFLADVYQRGRAAMARKSTGDNDIRLYVEATLGKPMKEQLQKTGQFLKKNRMVLKFECMWDDKAMYGERRSGFKLHYFLEDNTIEILEPLTKNSGRDPYPTMVKRCKMPKTAQRVDVTMIGHSDSKIYMPEDLGVGVTINVFDRPFLLTSADAYTTNWYKTNLGRTDADFAPIDVSERPAARVRPEYPPHNGIGNEEDSLGSCKLLVPKPPRKDIQKMLANDKKMLRYEAVFVDPTAEDRNRKFVIRFHLDNDALSIFEQHSRNSGFVGGKFLEKSKLKNPATGAYFTAADFAVGATVTINAHRFHIVQEDGRNDRERRESLCRS